MCCNGSACTELLCVITTRLKVQPARRTRRRPTRTNPPNSVAFWTSVIESQPADLPISTVNHPVRQSRKSTSQPATPYLALPQSNPRPSPPRCPGWREIRRSSKLGCGGSWPSSLLHFTSPYPLLGKHASEIFAGSFVALTLALPRPLFSCVCCSVLCDPWRSERSHPRQTSDRAASGKPWPNYGDLSDCFNLLHNMFSVTGRTPRRVLEQQ